MDAYTWSGLATVAGATAATLIVTQYVKAPLDRVWHVPTRLLVYVIALAILLVAQAAMGGAVWQDYLLAPLNAVVVAFAAMGAYEATFARGGGAKEHPPDR